MSAKELLHRYLEECPLIGIIRGITPDEAEAIGAAIHEGGIRIIEVPLNSPDPLQSIERLAKKFGDQVLVGAGTVLDPTDVGRVWDAGGRIIVSPDTNIDVIAAHRLRRRRRWIKNSSIVHSRAKRECRNQSHRIALHFVATSNRRQL